MAVQPWRSWEMDVGPHEFWCFPISLRLCGTLCAIDVVVGVGVES